MTETLNESLADIEALARRVSWELMDESQRDDFMVKVVVPRWGKMTRDGVTLKGTAWAAMVGATSDTIKHRYQRLTQQKHDDEDGTRAPSVNHRGSVRSAKSAIRQHPELATELVRDPDVRRAIQKATVEHYHEQAATESEHHVRADPVPDHRDDTWEALEGIMQASAAMRRAVSAASERDSGPINDDAKKAASEAIAKIRQACEFLEAVLGNGVTDEIIYQWMEE